ncbi:MAG: DUF5110 domain-containing protein [Deltaproteobacteria bacterium]|nr:DUF5110 domain-containing protein [Deltaproteobacteria bacterium]
MRTPRSRSFSPLAPLVLLIAAAFAGEACRNDGAASPDADGSVDAPDTRDEDVILPPPGFPTFTYGNADNADPDWIGNYASHRREGQAVVLEADGGRAVKVVVCERGLIRIVYAPHGDFEPDASYGVIRFDWPLVPYTVENRAQELVVSTSALHLRIWKRPLRFDFFDAGGALLSRDYKAVGDYPDAAGGDDHVLLNRGVDPDEKLYGLGERVATQLPLNGTSIENWNQDSYNADQGMRYKSFYLYYSTRGYGVFLDNSSRMTFEIDNAAFPDQLEADGHAGEMDFYFLYGPEFRTIVTSYTELTGRAYLPPKWALGYQQCRWAYETRARVEEIAEGFRSRDIPCDVIWLDGPLRGWWRNNVNFEPAFDDRYPDPAGMIEGLGRDGFKLALLVNHTMDTVASSYTDGLDSGYYVRNADGSVFLSSQWNGSCATVDFTNPAAGRWYAGLFDPLVDMGVAGWWIDMDDGGFPEAFLGYYDRVFAGGPGRLVHNAQGGLLDAQALHEHLRERSARRPYVMVRGGFTGQQRYAWTWSADLRFDDWSDTLAQQRMEQSMGLMGVVYGSDSGGSAATLGGNGESYTRWLQMEVFNFFTRSHVDGSEDKEPWSYGAAAEAASRKWLQWKYRMLPYIYTAAWEMSRTGVPLHRPLIFDYRTDARVQDMADEFLFGDWMLVAPVVHGDAAGSSDTSRPVYLPEGRWVDYRDGKTVYDGPTTLASYDAPLDTVPIFVRGGAIIPMEDWTEYVGQRPLDLVTLDVYPEGASSYTRYEDDGESLDYTDGAHCLTRFDCEETADGVTLTIGERGGTFLPPPRDYLLVVHNRSAAIGGVNVNGVPLPASTRERLDAGDRGWAQDPATALLTVRLQDTGGELRIEMR